MLKLPKNPNDWQQVIYAISHHLPGPIRRIIRQDVLWQWLYGCWWRYLFFRIRGGSVSKRIPSGDRRYITIVPGPDGGTAGIGDQISKWNTALVLGLKYHLKLAHHPFVRWWNESGWDEFLGFGKGERLYADILSDASIRQVWMPPLDLKVKRQQREQFVEAVITTLYPYDNVVFHLGDGTNLYDHAPSASWLRNKYWHARAHNPMVRVGTPGKKIIALHVRRGDLVDMKRSNSKAWQKRWLTNEYFVQVVGSITESLVGTPSEVHVYSEGNKGDFAEFAEIDDVVWHLNEDLKKTWHGFVTADILVTSPSSLSYHAGFLSTGVKIAAYPWWHLIPNGPDWIRSDRVGNLDKAVLREAVHRYGYSVK